jgi:hypothetical protein
MAAGPPGQVSSYQLTVPSEKASAADPAPYPVTLVLGPITPSDLYRDDHIVYTAAGEVIGTYALLSSWIVFTWIAGKDAHAKRLADRPRS